MKKYPLFALVFLLLLLVGTAFGLRDDLSTGQERTCRAPCFWGYVSAIVRLPDNPGQPHPSGWVEVPMSGVKVELTYPDQHKETTLTGQYGGYCFYRDHWDPGDYVLKVDCLEKHVYRQDDEDIPVDFLFRSPCSETQGTVIPPPQTHGEPAQQEPGNPQP